MSKNAPKPPFFSIITVTLNNVDGLKRTQSSVEQQSCTDYEWIIIDSGSSDGTPEHLKTTNAQWISEPDNGIYDAMNKGIDRATGSYLLFLNAGDELVNPKTLEHIQNTAKQETGFIYGDALENSSYKPARKPNIALGMFTHHQAMLYNRQTLGDTRYNTTYKIAADYDLTARFLTRHCEEVDRPTRQSQEACPIQYLPFPICIFESGGISQSNAMLGRKEQAHIRKDLALTNVLHNWLITNAQAALWQLHHYAPGLYWRLKSSGNTARVKAQSACPTPHQENPL